MGGAAVGLIFIVGGLVGYVRIDRWIAQHQANDFCNAFPVGEPVDEYKIQQALEGYQDYRILVASEYEALVQFRLSLPAYYVCAYSLANGRSVGATVNYKDQG